MAETRCLKPSCVIFYSREKLLIEMNQMGPDTKTDVADDCNGGHVGEADIKERQKQGCTINAFKVKDRRTERKRYTEANKELNSSLFFRSFKKFFFLFFPPFFPFACSLPFFFL